MLRNAAIVCSAAALAGIIAVGRAENRQRRYVVDRGEGDKLWLRDEKGMNAAIATADVEQKNGVIHVIDTAVMAN